jgi:GNAT superfamily N-acetyltransferase
MVFAPDRTLAAYGNIYLSNGTARLEPTTCVHPKFRDQGLEDHHLARALDWMRVNAPGDKLEWIVNDKHQGWKDRLEGAGFQWTRHDYVMEIVMSEAPPTPQLSNGYQLRAYERGKDDSVVWEVIDKSFEDHRGYHPYPYEEWSKSFFDHPDWSPALSTVVTHGDEVAAAAMAFNYSNTAWIRSLGVLREYRKNGLGLAMLHRIFGEAYARGQRKVGLGVDAESLTGATRLYERAGMHIKEHFIRYEKIIPVA